MLPEWEFKWIKVSTQRYLRALLLFVMTLLKCKTYHDNPLLKMLSNNSSCPIHSDKTLSLSYSCRKLLLCPLLWLSDLTNPVTLPQPLAPSLPRILLVRTSVVLSACSFLSPDDSLCLPQFPQAWATGWVLNMGNRCLCPVTALLEVLFLFSFLLNPTSRKAKSWTNQGDLPETHSPFLDNVAAGTLTNVMTEAVLLES